MAWFQTGVDAYLDGPMLLAGLAGLGLVVGVLTGLFGVGGAFMATPLLEVLFGIPYPQAIPSSLSFTIGTSASGVMRHLRLGNYEPRSMVMLAAGAMGGAVLGGKANVLLQGALGKSGSPAYTLTIHGIFTVVLLGAAAMIAWPSPSARGRKSLLQRLPVGPRIDLPAANLPGISVTGAVATGVLMGFTSGLLGIGGGVLMVPLLVMVVGLSPHKAVGTSLGVIVISAVAGTVFYGIKGDVNLWIVMPLLVGSTVGIQIGAAICERLQPKRLKQYFAVVLFVTAMVVASDFVHKLL